MRVTRFLKSLSIPFILITAMGCSQAEETSQTQTKASPVQDSLVSQLEIKLQLQIDAIADSPVPGLLQITTNRGIFYVTEDGHHFLQARLYNIEDGIVDLTESALQEMRLEGVKKFKDSAIEFKADNEKYVINVFTDTTCGYCQQFHSEIKQINDYGITVRYLAYPRKGIGSDVYRNTVDVWCSKDQQTALTRAKAGESVSDANCENDIVEQFNFGQRIGVNGTPNIILPNGGMLKGYQPADVLAQTVAQAAG